MANIEYTKKNYKTGWIIGGGMLSLIITISFILLLFFPFASTEKQTYFSGTYPILYKGKQEGNALRNGETIYIPLTFISEKLDQSITLDRKSNSAILTTRDKVIQMPSESLTYYINQKPVSLQFPVLKSSKGEWYIAISPIIHLFPIQFKQVESTGAILIQESGEKIKKAEISAQNEEKDILRLRVEPSLQSPYTSEVQHLENVTVEKESGEYLLVRKENGIAGYLNKKAVKHKGEMTITIDRPSTPPKLTKIKGPVHLTWEAVYRNNPNHANIPEMAGVNVVSPTWFKLSSADGTLSNLASVEYSNWAKKRGYQVWALFSNDFNPELTHQAFADFETRQNIIRQLLHFAEIYKLDGINFDIENVNEKDGPLVTQLLREATPYLHAAGLTVSMDVTFISGSGNWSAFYDREELSKIVDYMIVMAYDEHWGSSQVAGSVASLPWVETHLQKLLQVVPKERLILGVPLYTRLWSEQQLEDGSTNVSSKALSMEKAKEWIASKGIQTVYDQKTGQNYAEYYSKEEKITYKIWLEDQLSLSKRAELAKKFDLAGIASWSRYFADESAWTALKLDEDKDITKK